MQAVLEDVDTAPITNREKALFQFVRKVAECANEIRQEDLDAVKAAGWSEEAIYDAITVAALFKFYNTWIDATGVADMPPEAYDMSGIRLATEGYITREGISHDR